MPSCLHIVVLLALGLLCAGCAGPASPRSAAKKSKSAPGELDQSPEAVERRTEAHARYAAGVVLDLNENPQAAVEEYFKAAMADVNEESLVLEVTRRLLQLRQQDKALQLLQEASKSPTASGQLFARLGMVYSLVGRNEEALAANRMAIKKAPHSLTGYQNLVHIYLQNRQTEEALKVLDEASKQPDPEPT